MFEMEIVEKKGTSCRRLVDLRPPDLKMLTRAHIRGTCNYEMRDVDLESSLVYTL